VELNSGTFDPSDQEAIDERLRSRIPLEIESGLANYIFPIDAIPHDVLVKIAQNVLPLKELYAGILATLLYDRFKAASSKGRDERSEGVFEGGRLGCPHCGGSGRENGSEFHAIHVHRNLPVPYAYRGRYTEPKQEQPGGEARALLTRQAREIENAGGKVAGTYLREGDPDTEVVAMGE
jgi:hypothetical protein